MADRFEDHRGVIQDILPGPIDCVTRIFTRAGMVRGNHIHRETHQWTYIISGTMETVLADDVGRVHMDTRMTGDLFHEPPGMAHAWKAVSDVWVLVFTRGPRSGENYESDVQRLAPEDHLL
jgi:oxalate decarboxylase/phosphoglucose isomerase-like protein (cupin superfamily)